MYQSITTSNYTFEDTIRGNYLYVDKTDFIHQLINEEKGFYFLSRPRRFGKSLSVEYNDALTKVVATKLKNIFFINHIPCFIIFILFLIRLLCKEVKIEYIL